MILHIGCGDAPKSDRYLNVDIRDLPNVDVVADAKHLPFKDGEYDGIVTRNLVEHFDRNEIDEVFTEWNRVLKPGATISIETVDMGLTMSNWKNIPTENLLDAALGEQTYPENFHKMLFTKEIMVAKLYKAGFDVILFENKVQRQIPRMVVLAEKHEEN